jgi:hypothetical protein
MWIMITDKAYGYTQHLRPLHTSLALCLMNPNKQAGAEEEDAWNDGPRNGVEMSFNNIVQKFMYTDYFPNNGFCRGPWPL